MEHIYLDNNATTPLDPCVKKAMNPYMVDIFGNPNSQHEFGTATHQGINTASDQIYHYLNIHENDTFVMTSCATESINTIHKSILFQFLNQKNKQKNKVITSSLEHPASQKSLEFLTQFGIEIVKLPEKHDSIEINDFNTIFDPETTLLVSLIYAHNETGVILPIPEITKILQKDNIPIHIDATQAVGKIPVNIQELGINYLSCSAHKFHGPKGIGGLYIKDNSFITPLFHGGNQMGGFRAGTLNTPGIVGFGKALELAVTNMDHLNSHTLSLTKELEKFLLSINGHIYGINQPRLPNTIFVNIPYIDHDYMAWHLNKHNIAVSTGSACTSYQKERTKSLVQGVRFSLSRFSTENEIDKTIECIKSLL
ncbi:MAG: cysteine desulfurase family protein [Brevinema sp.]